MFREFLENVHTIQKSVPNIKIFTQLKNGCDTLIMIIQCKSNVYIISKYFLYHKKYYILKVC